MHMTPATAGAVGVVLSALLATGGFTLLNVTAQWWRTSAGWHVWAFMGALALVLDLSAARTIVGASLDAPWFLWLRVALFDLTIPLVLGWRVWIILQAQVLRYRSRHERHPDDQPPRHRL
jgi:hypothetical protein